MCPGGPGAADICRHRQRRRTGGNPRSPQRDAPGRSRHDRTRPQDSAVARWMVKHMSPQRFSRRFERDLAPVDRGNLPRPGSSSGLTKAFTEATRHGPRGLVEEMRLMGTPSGLDYTAVHCPIQLWHGDRDTFVPLRHAEHVVSLLPNANPEVLPGVGHLHRPETGDASRKRRVDPPAGSRCQAPPSTTTPPPTTQPAAYHSRLPGFSSRFA